MTDVPATSTTVIGADASFKGEISFEGSMRVEGKFDGKLTTKGKFSVGRTAEVQGEVHVGNLSIEGNFKGNVTAQERVEVAANAKFNGDMRAPKLVVAEGATLVGNFHISPDALKAPVAGTYDRAPVIERETVAAQAAQQIAGRR